MRVLIAIVLSLFFIACSCDDEKPVANAGSDQVIVLGKVQLDGRESITNCGKALRYRWSFSTRPGESNATLISSTTARPYFYADKLGKYSIDLIVNDTEEYSTPNRVNIEVLKDVEGCEVVDERALHGYAWQLDFHSNNFSSQYNIKNTSSICISEVWKSTKGVGVKVAIIDDSFEVEHEDFGANIINTYNVSNQNSDVSNKTGFTSHGTHTFSLMAALENDLGGVGVAPEAEYILIQPDFFNGTVFDSEIIEAFEHAKDQGAQLISNSWGSDDVGDVLEAEIKSIYEAGITLIFSVGNDGRDMDGDINDESELPWVIGVGASSETSLKTTYSNYGSNMDLLSPGGQEVGVLSADEMGSNGDNRSSELNGAINSNYHMFKGTSGSAPIVAGIAALLLSDNPTLTPSQIREILTQSADKIGGVVYDANGFNHQYAYGKVNAKRAFNLAQTYLGQ